jgi:cytoskeleton protein RodZ
MSSTPFGEHLKREREMRGVSLEEISLATRIAPRFLAALEREEWEKLPGGVFNRGFIRSVAHYLGLDEDSMVAEYALHTKGRPEPGVVADPPDEPETQWRQILVLVVFAVVVIAAGWAAVQYLVPRVTEYMHKRSATVSSAKQDDPSAPPLALNAVPANSDPAIVSAAPPLSAASTSNLAVPVLALKLQATRAADVNLVADGKTIFSGHLNPGDAKDLTATGSIQISSSEASAVLLDLNGKMVVLPGQPGQPSAITLTPKDLPPPAGASH